MSRPLKENNKGTVHIAQGLAFRDTKYKKTALGTHHECIMHPHGREAHDCNLKDRMTIQQQRRGANDSLATTHQYMAMKASGTMATIEAQM